MRLVNRLMLACALSGGTIGVAAAGGFEGTILMKDTSGGEVSTQKFTFKGDRLRVEEAGPHADGSAIIMDGQHRESFILDPDEQAYFPFPWPSQTKEEAAREAQDVVVTKTGKRDKVAGYACDLYVERDKTDGSTTELCIAKGLGTPALFGLTGGDSAIASLLPSWLGDMVKDGAFPLRGIERDKSGKELSRFEATKIEAKRLDDALFAPPKGYRRMNMEETGRSGLDR